jgi:hypothetical protein
MRNPFRTVHEMGLAPFAAMQLMLGGGIVAALVHGPLAVIVLTAALTNYDLSPADFILALCGYASAMFAALTACALSNTLSHARAALTMPLYWPLATMAALQALFELVLRPHRWAKTAHGVSQRGESAAPLIAMAQAPLAPAVHAVRQRSGTGAG